MNIKERAIAIEQKLYILYGCCGYYFCTKEQSILNIDTRPKNLLLKSYFDVTRISNRNNVKQIVYEVLKLLA